MSLMSEIPEIGQRRLLETETVSLLAEEGGAEILELLGAAADEDAEGAFTALAAAVEAGDAAAAGAAVHALKGTAGSLGLARVAALAERLMRDAAEGRVPSAATAEALAMLWRESMARFHEHVGTEAA
ncbi:MAG: Hpt domain-containing protein [Pseudomonadota bacterium]